MPRVPAPFSLSVDIMSTRGVSGRLMSEWNILYEDKEKWDYCYSRAHSVYIFALTFKLFASVLLKIDIQSNDKDVIEGDPH